MPFFDHSSTVFPKNPAPTKTYHSYMCQSKGEYLNKNAVVEKPTGKPTWISPQPSVNHDKCLQQNITKLRDILSDTIATLTRENNLKKGESVELTLEIELMKSMENTPTNSLVEVTIIQHNNKGEPDNKLNKIQNKMLFKIEPGKNSTDEHSLQKRQSWFKRVISGENTISKPSNELRDKGNEQLGREMKRKQLFHKPLFCPTANQRLKELNNPESHDTRSNFINILPEEITHKESVTKGYQKMPKREKRQEPVHDTCPGHGMPRKLNKKISLMKKISDVFLPAKKPSKNEVVETTLTALKNEIDSMKTAMDEKEKCKHVKKRGETPIHNLGKLVNNILFDVMDSMDGEDNQRKEGPTLPLQFQSFFEPIARSNKKHKKLTKRKTSPSIKKLYRSHSDTCVRQLKSDTGARIKSSNSISDCRSHMEMETTPEVVCMADTKQKHKKRRKRSNPREYSKGRKKNMNGEKRVLPNKSSEDNPVNNIAKQSGLFSRSSLIQWNGQYVKVSKDIKARIEMLIVNELENLALKEGMECDVTPLSSIDHSWKDSNTIEKMSSFFCELDISDKNVRKIIKRKKSLHRKVSVHHPPIEMAKTNKNNLVHKGRTRTTITSHGTQTVPVLEEQTQLLNNNNVNNIVIDKNEVDPRHITNNDRNPVPVQVCGDSVEIKYMNKNVQNWSEESQSITIYSPEMKTSSNQQNSTMYEYNSQTNKDKQSNRFVSTGFVKVITSNDSTWNTYFPQPDIVIPQNKLLPTHDFPESTLNTTGQTSFATEKSSSKTSNELDSSIEIELDIEDLEYILREAKENYHADKVLIEAKCVRPVKYHRPQVVKVTGKNSPSYTNQLLTNAAKKLEKYASTRTRNRKSQH